MKSHFPKTREMETTLNSNVAKTEKINIVRVEVRVCFRLVCVESDFWKVIIIINTKNHYC